MPLRVLAFDLRVLDVHTRLPFRYGIATLTTCPHLLCRIELEVDGRRQWGVSADNLPPKWFTKNPDTPVEAEIAEMARLIRAACESAVGAGQAQSVFDLWDRVYERQMALARLAGTPPLLAGFGPSVVERAVIDAFCRATGVTFADAVALNRFGVRLDELHAELAGVEPVSLLKPPLRSILARHTVGLSDPLTDEEIAPADRLDDGLPQSLEASIAAYGLTHFKLKLAGDASRDLERLTRIAEVLDRRCADQTYAFTLDGNENFKHLDPFRTLWAGLTADASLAGFLSKLIFVEQPLHRDAALSAETRDALLAWADRPPIIIDESGATLDDVRVALAGGYVGTSHKNCKGVFKGLANACLVEHRRRANPGGRFILSGEDLTNLGPVALQQDLAAMATLGVAHVERNGQHYFRGLSMWPEDVRAACLRHHADLYQPAPGGFPTPRIERGALRVDSVLAAPFGVGFDFDVARFAPLSEVAPVR